MMPRIAVNPGTPQAFELELKSGVNSLGRSSENDFKIDHESVSPRHCEILIEASVATLYDLESANGTLIANARVEQAALSDGQQFMMGQVALQFLADSVIEQETVASVSANTTSPSGTTGCRYHPKSPARHFCPSCEKSFCDLCVGRRTGGSGNVIVCRKCGSVCGEVVQPLGEPERTSFLEQLPGAFRYPLQKDAWALLVAGTLFYMFLGFLTRMAGFAGPYGIVAGLMIAVFGAGYLVAFMQKVLTSAAMGIEGRLAWPDFGNWQEDIVAPLLQVGCILAFCFWPAVLSRYFHGAGQLGQGWVMGAWILGLAYLPMAIIAVFMADSITALNPLIVIPAIIRLGGQYWVVCGLLGAMVLIRSLLNAGLAVGLPVPVLPALLSGFASLYFVTLEMRVLGLLHWHNKEKLGWF